MVHEAFVPKSPSVIAAPSTPPPKKSSTKPAALTENTVGFFFALIGTCAYACACVRGKKRISAVTAVTNK